MSAKAELLSLQQLRCFCATLELGSFTAAGFFGTLGLTAATGIPGLILGLLLTLIVAMFVQGTLNVMIEKVAYRPLRGAPKLAPLEGRLAGRCRAGRSGRACVDGR